MERYLTPGRSFAGPVASFDPGMSDGPTGENESALKLVLQFIGLLRRHALIVLLTAAAIVGITFYRISKEQPIYRATAVIRLVDKSRALSGGLTSNPSQPMAPAMDPILSQIQILQSRAVAKGVVDREGLRLRALPLAKNRTISLGAASVGDSVPAGQIRLTFTARDVIAQGFGATARAPYGQPLVLGGVSFVVTANPGVAEGTLAVVSSEQAIGELAAGLRGARRERTDIADVTYQATDPNTAQRVVNSSVEVFQAMNAKTSKQESIRRRVFIEQQLQKTEAALSEAQLAHNRFRSREQVYSSQERFKDRQADLTGVELRRQELQTNRGMYQNALTTLEQPAGGAQESERIAAVLSLPGLGENPVVTQLYAQLVKLQASRDSMTAGGASLQNPDVRRLDTLIGSTRASLRSAVKGQLTTIDAHIAALGDVQQRTASSLAGMPRAEAEEASLLSQVDTYQKEASKLRDELQKAEIEEAAEGGQVEIVDMATVPQLPIGSGRAPKLIIALILGLTLGGVLGYALENSSSVVRRKEELERTTRLPTLVVVPQIHNPSLPQQRKLLSRVGRANNNGNATRGDPSELVTLRDSRSSGSEAYRTLRTNLLFSAAITSMKRLVVTSAGPKEGKSTTASNLAVAFAQQGQRVLLIDCDLRKPRLHHIFARQQQPGLTNVLIDRDLINQAIRVSTVENLFVLPAGALPPNPAELLGSAQLRNFLDGLSEMFDLVILDTAPLLAASDAAILGRVSDGTLVVVRAGHTQRGAVQEAVQQLSNVGARVLGTVLNDPDAEVAKYARYHQYYYNNYYDYSTTSE